MMNKKSAFSVLKAKIPLWIIGVLLLVTVFLAVTGFRITYAPELENSWSAISAVAAWAGVIASTIAIIVAMYIPKRIADYQNKIALFEKRFDFYDALKRCIGFSQMIRNEQNADRIPVYFAASFGNAVVKNDNASALYDQNHSLEQHTICILEKGEFLFSFEMNEEINRLIAALQCITLERLDEEHYWMFYSDYMDAVSSVEKNLLPKVKRAVSLMQ